MSVWQLQEAKSKFSQLVEKAINQGPQIVTRRGMEAVVVISVQDYQILSQKKGRLIDLLQNAPKADLDFDRSDAFYRESDL